jgi:hypothetical protein
MGTEAIEAIAEELRGQGWRVSTGADGSFDVLMIENYRLPSGWSKKETTLLLKLPRSFQNGGKPDMFWTETDLTLEDGGVPDRGNTIEHIIGRQWRRFSWHPKSWTPGIDDIHTFLEFVAHRLSIRR